MFSVSSDIFHGCFVDFYGSTSWSFAVEFLKPSGFMVRAQRNPPEKAHFLNFLSATQMVLLKSMQSRNSGSETWDKCPMVLLAHPRKGFEEAHQVCVVDGGSDPYGCLWTKERFNPIPIVREPSKSPFLQTRYSNHRSRGLLNTGPGTDFHLGGF